MRNQRGRRLQEFIPEEGAVFEYEYDFGDGWEHDIVVERILYGANEAEPVCLEGARSCPPEDVGGPHGYKDYLEALHDPSHPEHGEMVMWSILFDPERFDLAKINRRLSLLPRRRGRA